ncbi:Cysteine protease 1 [Forsythia ovata]|uniref:Cysteine protease 1 n=1 Tax=Forsythia ovata TaxID=205694 RepID=A0ABD1XA93_9LAMI
MNAAFAPTVAVSDHMRPKGNTQLFSQGAEGELKHAVGIVRPVSVAFEVVTGFRFYKGDVYTSTKCGSTPMDVNHDVLAVGYGVENGIPYWLIKNSWRADWGDNGYFKMEMGKNKCGKFSTDHNLSCFKEGLDSLCSTILNVRTD